MTGLLWLVPCLPLLGATILGIAGSKLGERGGAVVGAGSMALAGLLASGIGLAWLRHPPIGGVLVEPLWTWIGLPGLKIDVGLYLDPVSLMMMLVITIVGFLIHLFSTEYMAGEDGYSRYFAYLNLFVAAMLLLVLASDLLMLFIGWEGVGICSYLLVGFWYRDPENGAAARKSFIVTRIADTAMLIGLLLLSVRLGTLSIQPLMAAAQASWPAGGVWPNLAAVLLLIGALGKSAQLPLQSWLPDAMAGPTPVSALIHAATMVTAGVYLIVRTHTLFLLAPDVLALVAIGGALTLLLAALSGLAQTDIKRVLAYSTISQIGYMFLAVGVGAWSAAMFHFLTHAVFKALLFLAAGAISMRLHHEQNIFRMGGLRRRIPLAFWCFLIGSASLAALPLISAGAFSKEMILAAVAATPGIGPALWLIAITGAVVTPTYIFRAVFVAFFGTAHSEVSGRYGLRISLPLVLLATAALTIGWLETPSFLGGASLISTMLAPAVGNPGAPVANAAFIEWAGLTAPILGVTIAYVLFRRGFWHAQAARPPSQLLQFMRGGFGFDTVFDLTLVRPFHRLSDFLKDDPVDQVFNALGHAAMFGHRELRSSQVGRIRYYAGWVMVGSITLVAIVVFG
jgi:NADH-quinone oxidoreductase subunit L